MRSQSAVVLARAIFLVSYWKNRRNPQNFWNFSRKKNLIFYTKIRSFMVGTKMKIKKFEKFVKNRRNITNFGDFSLFNKHHPVRPEPAAVLARSNFIETFWKNHKNPPKSWQFFEKKKVKIFIAKMDRSWLVQKSKNVTFKKKKKPKSRF